jgi:NAD(P)-dependent dehydrogenase (short-subunit alcohol dehydrogenase family)
MASAVVTGASQGIGKGIAIALTRGGYDIVAVARRVEPLEELGAVIEQAGGRYTYYQADLSEPDGVTLLATTISREQPDLRVLVNNAGGGIGPRPITETSDADWRRLLRLNVLAPYLLTKILGEAMAKNGGGHVINISSAVAVHRVATEVTSSAYVAAKGALHGLTRQSARLLAPEGVSVNAVLPGDVLTEAGAELFDSLSPKEREGVLSRVPIGRLTTPEEIGAAVASLCTPVAGAIVGVSLDVNGGAWMR